MRALSSILLGLALLVAAAVPARAAEEILSFHSWVRVKEDASLVVEERIVARVEGRRIKRGIYRDFPLYFRYPDGSKGKVGFELLSVRRDGQPESWHTKNLGDYLRIYIGKKNVFLRPGNHIFTLKYRTTRQIRYFDDHDELYWNVTGNFWEFPIRVAQVMVLLPKKVTPLRVALFTGPQGARESHARIARQKPGKLIAVTTRPLRPREGFTIVVALPKGVVAKPARSQRLWWRVLDMIGPFWLLAGVSLVTAWFVFAWWRHGRDPAPGVIIPRWEPPRGISPAAAHWIVGAARGARTDKRRALIAALVSLATKGFIEIDRQDGRTTLKKARAAGGDLPPGEALLMRELFENDDTFVIGKENGARLRRIVKDFSSLLEEEVERVHVVRNRGYFIVGVALAALTLVGLLVLSGSGSPSATTTVFMAMFVLMPVVFLGRAIWALWQARGLSFWFMLPVLLFLAMVPLLFIGVAFFAVPEDGVALPTGWRFAVFAALLALPLVMLAAWYLLPRPTARGREALDEIEGLKMFIETAEKARLNHRPAPGGRGAPPMSGVLFEKLLPYAIALGLEEPWTRAFQAWLASAGAAAAGAAGPHWYHGGLDGDVGRTIGEGLVSDISAEMAAAMPSHSSSGFSSSGGFSGGGGGGGGGGGW